MKKGLCDVPTSAYMQLGFAKGRRRNEEVRLGYNAKLVHRLMVISMTLQSGSAEDDGTMTVIMFEWKRGRKREMDHRQCRPMSAPETGV